MFARDHCYTCRACDENVSELELNHHHSKHHPEIPLDTNIYEVMEEINIVAYPVENENSNQNAESETESTENQLFICCACFHFISELELNHHHYKHHPDIPLDANIFELMEINDDDASPIEIESEDSSQYTESVFENSQQYMCAACGKAVSGEYLDDHHYRRHPKIPLEASIFVVAEMDEFGFI